jgi:acetylornithine deacetylase/succinyl-diaminopimelate desuccinylase-like protein
MFQYVEDLAEKIGPRGSTTRAERNAAKYLEETLAPIADEIKVQPFKSVPTFSWAFGLYYFLMVVAAVLIPFWPLAAAVIALLNSIAYLLESHTFEVLTRILPKDKSQNIIAKKANLGEEGDRLPRIIITAHYDTSRSALNFHPQLVPGFRQSFLIMNGSMAVILLLALIAGAAALAGLQLPGSFNWVSLPFALYLMFTVLILIHREIWGVHVHGGNDNASGVAVMLDSFRQLAGDLPEGAQVWAVATGCEEAGTVGMLRFLEEYGKEIRDDYIINLDNLGIGQVKYITGEGMFFAMQSNRELVLAAAACARENPALEIGPHVYKALTTDATPALARGYKVMSIMAFTEEGILPNWHWPTDRAEFVEPENLAAASTLVQSIARQIWQR